MCEADQPSELDLALKELRDKLKTPEGRAEIAAAAREGSDYIKKYERETRFRPENMHKPIAEICSGL